MYNIHSHNKRFNQTRYDLFGINSPINLRDHIEIPDSYKTGLVKCRIIYDKKIRAVEFKQYRFTPIRHVKIVHTDTDYTYKWIERDDLDSLYAQKAQYDDILIVKKGRITDTYYGNVALFRDGKWYTPKRPLLKGTQRDKLILSQRVLEKELLLKDLGKFSKLAIFNALRPFGDVVLPIQAIIQ